MTPEQDAIILAFGAAFREWALSYSRERWDDFDKLGIGCLSDVLDSAQMRAQNALRVAANTDD